MCLGLNALGVSWSQVYNGSTHVVFLSICAVKDDTRRKRSWSDMVLTHKERFAVASSVNGRKVVSPCFSLKFYFIPTTPQQNAIGLSMP